MKQVLILNIFLLFLSNIFQPASLDAQERSSYDICVYGGTSAGVIAAYSVAKYGKSVVLIEPSRHLGGMSSGGLGYTDIGNKYVVTGLSRDFYRRIGQHYGNFEQWIFEPKVAEAIFNDYVKRGRFRVIYERQLSGVYKKNARIEKITLESSSFLPKQSGQIEIRAKMFIDCTYEGDLMAKSGVSYTTGREANSQYGETFNGVQVMEGHQMPDGVDPYKIKGDPSSGYLWGISRNELQPAGSGDRKIQAYNFRLCLTDRPENRIAISKPANYDPSRYELLLRLMETAPWKSLGNGLIISRMPNGKTDINNKGGFSTDMIGENWQYPEGDYATRRRIWQAHTDYTKGLLYFLGHDSRVPAHIREQMLQWGYPKDEFEDNDHWPYQLYVREARRMIGELVMTQRHCQGAEVVSDGVGMAAYTMDSHNCDRLVIDGMVRNEGNVEKGGFGPYPISYRALVPKEGEVSNLLVPVCLSATHIAYGSIRMEPVFMVLAQSSAVAACMAINESLPVQKVNVARLRKQLQENPLCDGSAPEILTDNNEKAGVEISGSWNLVKHGGYGPDFLVSDSSSASPSFVKYMPKVPKCGDYLILMYQPKIQKQSPVTSFVIFDGKKETRKDINTASLKVEGQTSGEWVVLGKYYICKDSTCSIKIVSPPKGGYVAADAVLLVPQRK